VTTFLLAIVIVLAAMAMLGVGVILGRKRPLKGSCHGTPGEAGRCDVCQCSDDR